MSEQTRKPNFIQRLGLGMIKAGTWRPQTEKDFDRWMDTLVYGYPSSTGAYVSEDTATNFSAYFSGVFQICQTIASCPMTIYKQVDDFVKKAWSVHPAYKLLTRRANPFMNSFEWKELMQYCAIAWGNGYSYIQRDIGLRPIGLWPLNASRVTPRIDDTDKANPKLVYDFIDSSGNKITYNQAQIFHLRGFGTNGISGLPLLTIARESIGLGLSQQEFTGRFMANGTHMSGILLVKKKLSPEGKKRLETKIEELHTGVERAGSTMIVDGEEMDYKTLGIPLADAQFLESKVFEISEIARFLNISPYKLKDYSHATFSNIEHLGIEYATDTIRPWAERWEAAIDTQLFTEAEQRDAFAEFDLTAIHRGDLKTQAESYNMLRNAGAYSANEIRYKLGDNPIKDKRIGDMYWRPENMADASIPYQGGSNAKK